MPLGLGVIPDLDLGVTVTEGVTLVALAAAIVVADVDGSRGVTFALGLTTQPVMEDEDGEVPRLSLAGRPEDAVARWVPPALLPPKETGAETVKAEGVGLACSAIPLE